MNISVQIGTDLISPIKFLDEKKKIIKKFTFKPFSSICRIIEYFKYRRELRGNTRKLLTALAIDLLVISCLTTPPRNGIIDVFSV